LEFEFEFKIIGDVTGVLKNIFGAMKVAHTSTKSLCAEAIWETGFFARRQIFFDMFFDLTIYFLVGSEGDREMVSTVFADSEWMCMSMCFENFYFCSQYIE